MRKTIIMIVGVMAGACATAPRVPGAVHLGMSREQLIACCGQPYARTARSGEETYKYCERVYDTAIGNWWMTRPVKACTNVHLKEGNVIAFESASEKE